MNTLKILLYFSIFKYPLKKDEIYMFSNLENDDLVNLELSYLLEKKIIFKLGDYYLCNKEEALIKRRVEGNNMASNIFPKAKKVSKFIAKFPYVEGVAISGSLSKGYYDKKSDIDFFIITSPNRLWIARTILILYKKIFLFNSKKYFCVNYFVSSDALEIQEKNRFTATELVTLIPMSGKKIFESFYHNNQWSKKYFPKYRSGNHEIKTVKTPYISRIIEMLLKSALGDFLDRFFLKLTYKKWKQKFKYLDDDSFKIAMKSTRDISKHHPQNFQKKVIDTLNKKYSNTLKIYDITLEEEHA